MNWDGDSSRGRKAELDADAKAGKKGPDLPLAAAHALQTKLELIQGHRDTPWYKLFKGERINDHHLSLDEKRKSRVGREE